MKVVFIYRKYRTGAYSIEELFHTIAGELDNKVEIIEYEAGTRSQVLLDIWRLRKFKADIYHVTGDINYLVNLLPRNKTVLTIHDINHYLFDLSGVRRWLYKWIWLVLPIQNSKVVTTISAETRDNIFNHLDIADTHIEVIENCHSPIFKPMVRSFATECPFILQLGSKPNKNLPRLISALNGVHCHLVLIGRIDSNIRQQLVESGISFENHISVTHEDIYRYYCECDLVAFASLNEGFGVPIIEAQAVGRPVITSNLPPMRGVAGVGACLVDPLDVVEIHEAIQKIISDDGYRSQLVRKGFENVTKYSSVTISNKYLSLYKSLVMI